MIVMLSTLSTQGLLAEQVSGWPYILVFAVMAVAAMAALVSLKKS